MKCNDIQITERPNGKELEIKAQRISDNEFLINVKNLSNRKVFSAFEPNENRLNSAVPHITEKRNQNGEFVTGFDESSYAPQHRAIEANQEIGFHFFEIEKGDYRLIFTYLVDEDVARLLNDSDCLFNSSNSTLERIGESKFQAITPILTINKNIPIRLSKEKSGLVQFRNRL